MAPHNISLVDQLQELYEKKSKLKEEIEKNNDLQDFLDEQIDDNCWHLSNIPLRYQILHPATNEYKKLEKEEERLRKSCEDAKKQIEKLKIENNELKLRVNLLDNEIAQIK